MIFTSELLNQLERNVDLKKSCAAQGSMGQNRLIALPVVIGFIAAFAAYGLYDILKTEPDYQNYAVICAVVVAVCILSIIIIQVKAKKKVGENLEGVKVCIVRKIAGNDNTQVYYGIYTVGNKRHDTDFIEGIAYAQIIL